MVERDERSGRAKATRAPLAGVCLLILAAFSGCGGLAHKRIEGFDFNLGSPEGRGNIANLGNSLSPGAGEGEKGEGWFALIADTQNLVRANDFNHFNLVARHLLLGEDDGGRFFDKISFIVHNGDFVYNGADRSQWDALKRAFSSRDYKEDNTPYIKMLVRDKPLLPALGNHDLMKLKLRPQTAWRDLAGSEAGLRQFQDFFNWEELMASGKVISPIPAEISEGLFEEMERRLDGEDRPKLRRLYLKRETRWYLRIWQDLIRDAEKNPEPGLSGYERRLLGERAKVMNEAREIFDKLGYRTLPSLSSDSMACYAVEFRGMLLVFLDSMARGWHYPQFSRLKEALFREKKSQHRLNLFSPNRLNGQYDFFRALRSYAEERNMQVAVFMHHSPLNSVNVIGQNGIEFNLRLILGLERETYGPTFWDELLFGRLRGSGERPLVTHLFTSCIHYFQQFSLRRKDGRGALGDLVWTISGGGGGAPEAGYDDKKLSYSLDLYRKALGSANPALAVELTANRVELSYNFLLVKVRDGGIEEVKEVLVPKKAVRLRSPSLFDVRASWRTAIFSRPVSMGQIFRVSLFSIGMEGVSEFLQFITLDPSLSMGFLDYNQHGDPAFTDEYSGVFELSPLVFHLRFPGQKTLTLYLGEILFITGQHDHAAQFLSFGAEMPLFHNLFGTLRNLQFGFRFYVPVELATGNDPDFGSKLRFSTSFGYHF